MTLRRRIVTLIAPSLALLAAAPPAFAGEEPAGGAALDQVFIATAGAAIATAVVLWLIAAHRAGKAGPLTRAADHAERVSGLPGWAALPSGVAAGSLLIALLGMYWDISLHIDEGRDAGPLANPAHYLILVGLFGVFTAGCLAIALPREGEKPGPAALKLSPNWYAPVGGVLIAACGAFALIGFPLDDVWHRIFGQDVTLWGPTHLMLIGGAGMTLIGQAVLLQEGMRARKSVASGERDKAPSFIVALRRVGLMGGLLIGLSTFQAEFDFGVPQFAAVFGPILVTLAAAVALVCARIWVGPGGAVAAAAFFLGARGLIALIVGPVLGETTPALPLYLGSAVFVELAGLFLASRRPLAFGVAGGLLAATAGLATEWAWTHAVMPIPWTEPLLGEAIVTAILTGVAGGLVGALLGLGLRGELPSPGLARGLSLGSLAVVAVVIGYGLSTTQIQDGARTTVSLEPAGDGEANATVRVQPASLAEDAKWLSVTAWQGGGLVVDHLERVGAGVYRTTQPIPVDGDWKTLVRLHEGRAIGATAVYMPRDTAIPAPEVPARAQVTRPMGEEKPLLQRELKSDVPGWLWPGACLLVLTLALGFLGSLAWGVARVARRDPRPPEGPAARTGGRFERTATPERRPLATSGD